MNQVIITREDLKNIYGSTIYNRGLHYYKEGQVYQLEYDKRLDTWSAKVAGNRRYHVELKIVKNRISSACNCPAFDNFGGCKHEVAVLLNIIDRFGKKNSDQGTQIFKDEGKYKNTNIFLKALSQLQYNEVKRRTAALKETLMVEFYLSECFAPLSIEGNSLSISAKVGEKRLYVIKDIRDFLKKLELGQSIYFTDNFIYEPLEYFFPPEDMEVLQVLQDIIRNEKVYKNQSSHYPDGDYYLDKRELIIPPLFIDSLLNKLSNKPNQKAIFRANDRIEIKKDQDLLFNLKLINNSDGDFVLGLSELRNIIWFKEYGLVYYKKVFYRLNIEQRELVNELNNFLVYRDDQELIIKKDQIEHFFSHAEPVLKKIAAIEIDDSISDQLIAPALKAKIFIDYIEEQLRVNIEYHYDKRIIDPFQPKAEDNSDKQVILVRDIEKEQYIMNLFEDTSLKFNGKELYLEGEEEIYDFLYNTLTLLEDYTEVYMTNPAKGLINLIHYQPQISIELDSKGNWLEVGFDNEELSKEDIYNILQTIVEKKRYYRLADGSFISVEDKEYHTISQLLTELKASKEELKQGSLRRHAYRGLQVADLLASNDIKLMKYGKNFRRFLQDFKNPELLEVDLPQSLNAQLRDYQEFGFKWMKILAHYRLGGILADDMGLGKTIQSIALIASEIEEDKLVAPTLIVTPAALIYNWKNEFTKFAPNIVVKIITGLPEERKEMLNNLKKDDVLITSYPLIRQDIEFYQDISFDILILDEAQAIKNPSTKISKAMQQLKANKRFALSGTPIENSIIELWSIFQVILPGFFPNKSAFAKTDYDKISRMVRPFILRRLKRDVLKELPDKIETVQISELTREQKEIYLGYLEKIKKDTKESIERDGFNKNRIKILAGLMRLRQICNHPALFLENYTGKSSKLEQLIELIENNLANQQRMLIFSQFSSMLKMIRERLYQEGYSCFYIDGDTPAKERFRMAEEFNTEKSKEIFLVSLKAGGIGLNLTGAETVILFDLWWNPAVEEQAAGRAHRIGQKKVVQVIRLISNGTIEEKIYQLQQDKKELIGKVIKPDEEMFSSLTEEDILDILNMEY